MNVAEYCCDSRGFGWLTATENELPIRNILTLKAENSQILNLSLLYYWNFLRRCVSLGQLPLFHGLYSFEILTIGIL